MKSYLIIIYTSITIITHTHTHTHKSLIACLVCVISGENVRFHRKFELIIPKEKSVKTFAGRLC